MPESMRLPAPCAPSMPAPDGRAGVSIRCAMTASAPAKAMSGRRCRRMTRAGWCFCRRPHPARISVAARGRAIMTTPIPWGRCRPTPPDGVFNSPPVVGSPSCDALLSTARNDGLYTPPSTQGTVVFPFTGGGVNWGGAAFDPIHQILYANITRAVQVITLVPRTEVEGYKPPPGIELGPQRGAPFAMTRQVAMSRLGLLCNRPPWGEMVAVD